MNQRKVDALKQMISALKSAMLVETKKEVAERMGISESALSRATCGDERYLTDKMMRRCASFCRGKLPDDALIFEYLPTVDGYTESIITTPTTATIPLLPVDAIAGSLGDFTQGVSLYDCEQIKSPIRNADYAIKINGESMTPEYPNGSIALIKRINEDIFIEFGKVYILDTENGTIVKRVYPTENPDVFECRSINPAFPPFQVSKHHILGWYRILMTLITK